MISTLKKYKCWDYDHYKELSKKWNVLHNAKLLNSTSVQQRIEIFCTLKFSTWNMSGVHCPKKRTPKCLMEVMEFRIVRKISFESINELKSPQSSFTVCFLQPGFLLILNMWYNDWDRLIFMDMSVVCLWLTRADLTTSSVEYMHLFQTCSLEVINLKIRVKIHYCNNSHCLLDI